MVRQRQGLPSVQIHRRKTKTARTAETILSSSPDCPVDTPTCLFGIKCVRACPARVETSFVLADGVGR